MEYDVTKILPQQPPMQFITAIESADFDNETLVARVDVRDTDLLFQKNINGVATTAALEYMAQAIACYIGTEEIHKTGVTKAAAGFILGSRDLHICAPVFNINESYYINVKSVFCDSNMAAFECNIFDSKNNLMASATLNAFRPDDITTFMGVNNE